MARTEGSFPTAYYNRLQQHVEPWHAWLTAALVAVGIAAILSLSFIQTSQVDVTLDMPSPERIEAPQTKSFVSNYLTAQQQQAAADAVPDVYTDVDRSIARTQLNLANELFNYTRVVRADSFATQAERIDFLKGVEIAQIDDGTANLLLTISSAELEGVQSRATSIIGSLMRREIREDNLGNMAEAVEREIDLTATAAQESLLLAIVPQLIKSNTFYDEVATEELRTEASASVDPVAQEVIKGDLILRQGERVTAEKLELLQELGLLQESVDLFAIARIILISALSSALIFVYYIRFHLKGFRRRRYLLLLAVALLAFIFAGQVMITQPQLMRYLFPAAALAVLVAVVYGRRFAGMVTLVVGGLLGYAANGSLEFAFYVIVGSLFAIFSLGGADRINAFFRSGLIASIGNILVVAIFNLTADVDPIYFIQLIGLAVSAGVLSATLALAWFYLAGSAFGITTMLQLQELSRFDQPLLQQLLHLAPGTYHHSIMVANLAEQAADRIGANSLLARVGAFYHDIGKMVNPPYFSENQEGSNPHDTLDPFESARYIIGHVTDGLVMARKEGLPEQIQDFIAEHHGDHLLKFFYEKAEKQASENDGEVRLVDEMQFRYPGPAPRSRETGIVMLADVVEATSKAVQPNNVAAIEKLVRSITDNMVAENQLDNSGLTFNELRAIRESFVETLKGRYHVRVKYAGNDELEAANTPPIEGEMTPAPSMIESQSAVSSD